jgi:cysteine synthase A
MLPDTGERYMSTPLFEGIDVDMNEAELSLSRSTPGYRFDAPPPPAPAIAEAAPAASIDESADAFVTGVIGGHAVVMFALEWCEFCWAVRKLFAKLGIPYESVDLDSVQFQQRDQGTLIRAVLRHRIGSPTIPQIYIGGRHMGGCMDLFDAMSDGSLRQRLAEVGVEYDRHANVNPQSLLPQWLHPRQSA